MKITLFSFGFKHGQPEADIVFDVRFLPNPYWEIDLRPHTGLEQPIAAYVLDNPVGQEFIGHLEPFLSFSLASHKAAGRKEVRCAVGCTGGQHRSVAVTVYLEQFLSGLLDTDDSLLVSHRDIDKKEDNGA